MQGHLAKELQNGIPSEGLPGVHHSHLVMKAKDLQKWGILPQLETVDQTTLTVTISSSEENKNRQGEVNQSPPPKLRISGVRKGVLVTEHSGCSFQLHAIWCRSASKEGKQAQH